MGNSQSRSIYWKLHFVVPEEHGNSMWDKASPKPFASEKDREQFIYGLITVLTQNGAIPLPDHNFRLLYSRRELGDGRERVVARIVAEKNGVIEAKVEPEGDGKDHAEAFRALRKDVEVKLERILSEVPADGVPITAGPSRSSCGRPGSGGNAVTPVVARTSVARVRDAPPAYGDVKAEM